MGKAVRELAHGLCQRGEPIRKYALTHPVHLQDMDRVDGFMVGKKNRTDRKFGVMSLPPKCTQW
jgi:hypothetical protein